MKKLAIIVSAFVVFLFVPAVKAEIQKKNAVGLSVSYAKPKDLENGVGFGVNIGRYLLSNLFLEFAAETYNFDDVEDGITFGKVRETPIMGTIQFRPRIPLSPYIGAGIGYYLLSFDEADTLTDFCLAAFGEDCTFKVDNTFAFHASAGLDYLFTQHIGINFDIRYAIGKADATFGLPLSGISVTDKVDIDYYKLGIGVKYWF